MIVATFTGNELVLHIQTTSWQYDTGQVLSISGIDGLNAQTEVHFERKLHGDAVVKKGAYDSESGTLTVDIPNVFFEHADGAPGRVWIYPRTDEETGQTVREINIPIAGRERPDDYISQADLRREDVVTSAVGNYLNDHEEIVDEAVADYMDAKQKPFVDTESLFDGAVTPSKLSLELAQTVAGKANLADVYTKEQTDALLRDRAPSVKDYGAKGDGVTDDTDAIYKAIVRNDVVYFPPGTYRTAGIIITNPVLNEGGSAANAKTLFGAGRKSVIKPITVTGVFCRNCGCVYRGTTLPETCNAADGCGKPNTYFTAFEKISDENGNSVLKIGRSSDGKTDVVDECTVSDLTIDARERAAGTDGSGNPVTERRFGRGLYLYGTNRTTVHNVAVYLAGSNGFEIADGARDCHFTNIKVKNCKNIGVKYYGFGNSFANVETSQNEGDGVNITTGGCQFANVKAWANRKAGLRINGAKHCMIANVNSQQNRGSGLVIEGDAAYNVVTGFESVGNNFTLKNTSTPWEPNLTFEGGSGLVVGGHDNNVQGSDVRARWDINWKAVEKSALYIPEGSHDNRVDLVCAEGDKPLSEIYAEQDFADIGFDQSVLYAKHNSLNRVHISSSTEFEIAEFSGELMSLRYVMQHEYDETHYTKADIYSTPLEFASGYIKTTNVTKVDIDNPVESSDFRYSVTRVKPGERFRIDVKGATVARAWAFLKADKTVIYPQADEGATVKGVIEAPENSAYLVVNDKKMTGVCYRVKECVLTIDENSDDTTFPSAKAVYDAIQAALGGVTS